MEETIKLILAELQKTNKHLDYLDEGQKSLEKGLVVLDEGQKSLEKRMVALDEGQKSLEKRMVALDEGQKSLEKRMAALDEGQKSLEKGMVVLDEGQISIREGQQRMESRLQGIPKQYEYLERFLDHEFKNQQNVIETLSVRSIRQEAEIKEIQQIVKNQ